MTTDSYSDDDCSTQSSGPRSPRDYEASAESDNDIRQCDGNAELLRDLISIAPKIALRDVLTMICEKDALTKGHWLIKQLSEKIDNSKVSGKDTRPGKKRKRTRECKGCTLFFDEEDNRIGDCSYYVYHPSPPEQDLDHGIWDDDDFPEEAVPGENDNLPGFTHRCCDQTADYGGCARFRHIEAMEEPAHKRPKN